jgi:hypothetical protein
MGSHFSFKDLKYIRYEAKVKKEKIDSQSLDAKSKV